VINLSRCCVITTACNRKEICDKIIKSLLEKRLVSVCQVFDMQSTYWWEDKIVTEPEYFIQMKTKKELFNEVKEEILRIHDYDICEIASYDLENGSDSFLNWVEYETK